MDNIRKMFFALGFFVIFNGCTTFSSLGEAEEIDPDLLNVTFRIHFDDAILDFEAKERDGTYIKDFDGDLYWGSKEKNPIGIGVSVELEIISIEESQVVGNAHITRRIFVKWQNVDGGRSSSVRIPLIRNISLESQRSYDVRYESWIDFVPEQALEAVPVDGTDVGGLPKVEIMFTRANN